MPAAASNARAAAASDSEGSEKEGDDFSPDGLATKLSVEAPDASGDKSRQGDSLGRGSQTGAASSVGEAEGAAVGGLAGEVRLRTEVGRSENVGLEEDDEAVELDIQLDGSMDAGASADPIAPATADDGAPLPPAYLSTDMADGGGEGVETADDCGAAAHEVTLNSLEAMSSRVWGTCAIAMDRAANRYCKLVIKYPWFIILFYLSLTAAVIAACWRDFVLETDFSAFIKADGNAMRLRDAYMEALSVKKGLRDRRLGAMLRDASGRTGAENDRRLGALPRDASAASELGRRLGGGSEGLEADLLAALGHDGGRALTSELDEIAVADDEFDAEGRRLQASLFTPRELTLAYVPKNGLGALDEPVLRDVRSFEQELANLPGWKSRCVGPTSQQIGCAPGDTITTLAWPTQQAVSSSGGTFTMVLDGKGPDVLQPEVLLAQIKLNSAKQEMNPLRFFPKGYVLPDVGEAADAKQPEAIRSHFVFRLALGTLAGGMARVQAKLSEVKSLYEEWIASEVYPLLQRAKTEYKNAHIFYTGDVIQGHEINYTLFNDLNWAIGSVFFVLVYIFCHTRSVVISAAGLFIIFLSIPVAYVLSPASKTTIASFLSVFLMTGVGSDVIFVFIDFWNDGKHLPSMEDRVKLMIKNAGNACLATSLTTSVSFFANLASALQPLREFGLFMGNCVMCAFLLILFIMPPLLVVVERQRAARRQKVANRKKSLDIDISRGQRGALSPEDKAAKEQTTQPLDHSKSKAFLFNFVEWISFCPCAVLTVSQILVIVSVVGVVLNIKLDQGVPAIFPPDHNQVAGAETFKTFGEVSRLTRRSAIGSKCCALGNTDLSCNMFWCHAVAREVGSGSNATCFLQDHPSTCPTASDIRIRFAMPSGDKASRWQTAADEVAEEIGASENLNVVRSYTLTSIVPLALETWETGSVLMRKHYQSEYKLGSVGTNCIVDVSCFPTAFACDLAGSNGWTHLGTYRAAATRRLRSPMPLLPAISPTRRLATVRARDQVDISIVWGILPSRFTPIVGPPTEVWRHDPTFYIEDPWAQRALYRSCTDMPSSLKVARTDCWITAFRNFLRLRRRKFPSRNFDSDLSSYWDSTIHASKFIWIDEQTKRLKACYLYFYVDVSKFAGARSAIDYMAHWDTFVEGLNKGAAVTANKAYHTSSLWVRAEAEVAIIDSTTDTIIISASCAFAGMLVFTRNFWLALYVLILVLGVIIMLAYFIVGIMSWAVGPVEVIALVVFVGYSVTYALHIAHAYGDIAEDNADMLAAEALARARRKARRRRRRGAGADDDEEAALSAQTLNAREVRVARTRLAMLQLGTATASSSVSTIGSSIFLLACTLSIFVKLGSVVLAVTLLAILCALIALPALLMVLGPQYRSPFVAYLRTLAGSLAARLLARFLASERLYETAAAPAKATAERSAAGFAPVLCTEEERRPLATSAK